MHVLVTGGAGYIGSHTAVQLLEAGHRLTVVDSLVNASAVALDRVREISGRDLHFVKADLLDSAALDAVFAREAVDVVIHFAALKAVGESVREPLRYYHNNVTGTLHLLERMVAHNCRRLVFSSSATVYGDPASVPVDESSPLDATNPYGRTKLMMERIITDLCAADPAWHAVLLRYFNPVGAHPSGRIGEDPNGIPNNLMPFITQVAIGRLGELKIYGNDYPTPDGTGVRDYIHVQDLAAGHVAALERIEQLPGCTPINLGTGRGYSVLEMVAAFARASGREIPYHIVERRPGDIAACWADPALAQRLLGWQAGLDIDAMCRDAWAWQSANPQGYGDE